MGRTTELKWTPDEIALAIRERILCGNMEPGTTARQDELAKQFRVSRVPVREALRSLAAEGLMTWEPQRGFKVARVAPEEAREILEIRAILEVQALRKGFAAITPEVIHVATAILSRAEHTASIDEWSELNSRFHDAILKPAQRPQLLSLIKQLSNRVDRYIRLLIAASDYRHRAEREHRAIVAAIEVGNVEAAVSLLSQHIEDTSVRLDDFLAGYRTAAPVISRRGSER